MWNSYKYNMANKFNETWPSSKAIGIVSLLMIALIIFLYYNGAFGGKSERGDEGKKEEGKKKDEQDPCQHKLCYQLTKSDCSETSCARDKPCYWHPGTKECNNKSPTLCQGDNDCDTETQTCVNGECTHMTYKECQKEEKKELEYCKEMNSIQKSVMNFTGLSIFQKH